MSPARISAAIRRDGRRIRRSRWVGEAERERERERERARQSTHSHAYIYISAAQGLADPPLDDAKAAKKAAKLAEKAAKAEKLKLKKQKQAEMKKDSGSDQAKAKVPKKKVGGGAGADEEPEEALPPTPPGEKKILTKQMQKTYSPKAVESSWYDWWDAQGFFKADPSSTKPKFVIVIPPPNVTGSLHLGHALTNSIEVYLSFYVGRSGGCVVRIALRCVALLWSQPK